MSNKSLLAQYTSVDVLAISFEVHAKQGFIKSGYGYVKSTDEVDAKGNEVVEHIYDNKSVMLNMMTTASPELYSPPRKYIKQATAEIDRINGKLMMKKLGGGLSNFEQNIVKALTHEVNNFYVSLLASIPNSISIDKQRDDLHDIMLPLKHSSKYFGTKATRYDIDVDVIDVKFIQSSDVYMVTSVYKNKDVIKFWWNQQPDIADIIQGKTISIRGTVKAHELSKYSGAHETTLNRVKFTSVN